MRNIFGFGVVLAVAGLMATVSTAYGQAGAGGRGAGGSTASTVINDVNQAANAGAPATPAGTTAPVPGQAATATQPGLIPSVPTNTNQAIGTAGNVVNPAGTTTPTGTNYQVPGTAGNVLNQTGVMPTTPGTVAPGTVPGTQYAPGTVIPGTPGATTYSSNYYAPGTQAGTNPASVTAATPGYAGQVMPGMAGYNSVNPMGTTMAPGYYYAGTAGMPYATSTTPGYYTAAPQTYTVRQRRGLFGGIFGRRNRVVYPANSYGTTYTTTPYSYTTTGYNTVTTPGTYIYSTSPY